MALMKKLAFVEVPRRQCRRRHYRHSPGFSNNRLSRFSALKLLAYVIAEANDVRLSSVEIVFDYFLLAC